MRGAARCWRRRWRRRWSDPRPLSRTLDAGPVIDLPVALDPSTGRVLVRLPPEGPRGEARFGCVEAGSVAEIDRAEAVGRYEVGGRSIAFTPGVFTQANLAANERLVARVLAELAVDPPKMLLDLYSGVGNYAIPAASLAGEIRGIEQDVDAVAMAAQAAREQDLEHLSFSALAADGALDRIVAGASRSTPASATRRARAWASGSPRCWRRRRRAGSSTSRARRRAWPATCG